MTFNDHGDDPINEESVHDSIMRLDSKGPILEIVINHPEYIEETDHRLILKWDKGSIDYAITPGWFICDQYDSVYNGPYTSIWDAERQRRILELDMATCHMYPYEPREIEY